jgi:cation-transporting ATPase 13A1
LTSENKHETDHLAPVPGQGNGVVCYVIKNGFETKQGKLMRTILFSSERVSAESKETYYFLLILLCFALVSAYYVVTESLKDQDRSRYKILLRCIMIITNVVPPELPMELSMAVNYSILQMIKKSMFCTEPFRIPSAGKVDVCCFDKTGTLTKNDLNVKGIIIPGSKEIMPCEKVPSLCQEATRVVGGCHTLAYADKQLMGDPIEK